MSTVIGVYTLQLQSSYKIKINFTNKQMHNAIVIDNVLIILL